jgi:hypothetical protein
MKKRNITLCAVAMLCMQGYAKADTFILKGDNTCVENYAQMTAAYKSNRPKMNAFSPQKRWKLRLFA